MEDDRGVRIAEVIEALDTAAIEVVPAPDPDARIGSVSLIDADELSRPHEAFTDAVLAAGVGPTRLARWLATRSGVGLPRVIAIKSTGESADFADADVCVILVDPRARWDRVLGVVQWCLDRADERMAGDSGDVDLFGLVGLVAQGTGGLVSIEDATSARVLAYSPSMGEADDLRAQTILGRAGPPAYLDLLRQWGVFDAIRRGGEVVDVPEHPEQAMRRRLVVGIHDRSGRHLGSIWVQEGARSLAADSSSVLRGAAAVAARILGRAMQVPSTEGQLLQRLFGEHGGIDPSSAGAYLRWRVDERAAVIGIEPAAEVAGALRLHASAYQASALTAVIGPRAYVLVPATSAGPITTWLRGLVTRFDGDPALDGAVLHAAVVFPVDGLAAVPQARAEVDRVLAATAGSAERVTTLEQARTAVLLGEILDVVAEHEELRDPRVDMLAEYDADHGSSLVESVRVYLDAHGNVRDAAARLGVHTNTLRYRIDRAELISGLRLDDPDERLLTGIGLAVRLRI